MLPGAQTVTLAERLGVLRSRTATLITFQWSQLTGPTVALSAPTAAVTKFSAAAGQAYSFLLTVTDNLGAKGTASVQHRAAPAQPPAAPTIVSVHRQSHQHQRGTILDAELASDQRGYGQHHDARLRDAHRSSGGFAHGDHYVRADGGQRASVSYHTGYRHRKRNGRRRIAGDRQLHRESRFDYRGPELHAVVGHPECHDGDDHVAQ